MTAADQIAEINAQFAERVKLLEQERDAKVAMVRERCVHEPIKKQRFVGFEPCIFGGDEMKYAEYFECKHCGASMPGSE